MDEQKPGIFENGDHDDSRTNERDGRFTDKQESQELISNLGERAQVVAGGEKPRKRGRRKADKPKEQAPTNAENPITDRFGDEIVPPGTENETSPYGGERHTSPFTDGDKTHGWSSGVGEQQGSEQDSTT